MLVHIFLSVWDKLRKGIHSKQAYRLFSLMIACSIFGVASCDREQTPVETDFSAALEKLSEGAEHEMSSWPIPGMVIVVSDGEKTIWSKAYGHSDLVGETPLSPDSVFRIGSISKLFTDIALMRLAEEGKVDLDAPVTDYIPEFSPKNAFSAAITLRQLMSHRSGLVREPPVGHYFADSEPGLAETVLSLNDTSLVAPPGELVKYSNAGVAVVGYVIERVTGKPYDEAVMETVLSPLRAEGFWFYNNDSVRKRMPEGLIGSHDDVFSEALVYDFGMAPAANLYATPEALLMFARALMNGGQAQGGERIVSRETLEMMWAPTRGEEGQSFGIGFQLGEIDGRKLVYHGGAVYGFNTRLYMLPEEQLAIAVFSTLDQSSATTKRLARYGLRAMLAASRGQPLPDYPFSHALSKELRTHIAGYYESDEDDSLLLNDWRGRLYIEGGGYANEIRRVQEGWCVVDYRVLCIPIDLNETEQRISIEGDEYRRKSWIKPPAANDDLAAIMGDYGWRHDYIRIYEWDGKPFARIEWYGHYPLSRLGSRTYAFPEGAGLYPHEQLRFEFDQKGNAVAVSLNGIRFPRRDFGAELEARLQAGLASSPELRDLARRARPPEEAGDFLKPDLVDLERMDPTIRLDIRYATDNNFMGMTFYDAPKALLQRPAAEALWRAHKRLAEQGYGLLIHDAYRPWFVTKMFWDATPTDGKPFVADPLSGSRHNRGAAVDLTLYDLATGEPLGMTGHYDEFSARSQPGYVGGSELERWHRDLLRNAFEAEGFEVYETEWWHFDFGDWRRYPILNTPLTEIQASTP